MMTNEVDEGVNITVSAPGKVILHGEHSVVYGKLAIAASIDLRTTFSLTELVDGQHINLIVLDFQNLQLLQSFSIEDLNRLILNTPIPLLENSFNIENPEFINHVIYLDKIDKFVKLKATNISEEKHIALVSFLYLYCALLGPSGVPLLSIKIVLDTQLTIGAGLGSSASFLVTLVAGLLEYIKVQYRKNPAIRQTNFGLSLDNRKGYSQDELKLISKWAFNAEKIIHGTPSGVDNTTCTFGSVVKFRKGNEPEPLSMTHQIQVLLINTRVPKNTKTLIQRVVNLQKRHAHVIEPIWDAMEAISQCGLQYLLKLSEIESSNYENVLDKQTAMRSYYEKLGELADINQNLLRAINVSHSTLDAACAILAAGGLHGKLTGAGGGGYAIAIVPFDFDVTRLEHVKTKLTAHGFEVQHTELGGNGVLLH